MRFGWSKEKKSQQEAFVMRRLLQDLSHYAAWRGEVAAGSLVSPPKRGHAIARHVAYLVKPAAPSVSYQLDEREVVTKWPEGVGVAEMRPFGLISDSQQISLEVQVRQLADTREFRNIRPLFAVWNAFLLDGDEGNWRIAGVSTGITVRTARNLYDMRFDGPTGLRFDAFDESTGRLASERVVLNHLLFGPQRLEDALPAGAYQRHLHEAPSHMLSAVKTIKGPDGLVDFQREAGIGTDALGRPRTLAPAAVAGRSPAVHTSASNRSVPARPGPSRPLTPPLVTDTGPNSFYPSPVEPAIGSVPHMNPYGNPGDAPHAAPQALNPYAYPANDAFGDPPRSAANWIDLGTAQSDLGPDELLNTFFKPKSEPTRPGYDDDALLPGDVDDESSVLEARAIALRPEAIQNVTADSLVAVNQALSWHLVDVDSTDAMDETRHAIDGLFANLKRTLERGPQKTPRVNTTALLRLIDNAYQDFPDRGPVAVRELAAALSNPDTKIAETELPAFAVTFENDDKSVATFLKLLSSLSPVEIRTYMNPATINDEPGGMIINVVTSKGPVHIVVPDVDDPEQVGPETKLGRRGALRVVDNAQLGLPLPVQQTVANAERVHAESLQIARSELRNERDSDEFPIASHRRRPPMPDDRPSSRVPDPGLNNFGLPLPDGLDPVWGEGLSNGSHPQNGNERPVVGYSPQTTNPPHMPAPAVAPPKAAKPRSPRRRPVVPNASGAAEHARADEHHGGKERPGRGNDSPSGNSVSR